MSLFESAVLLSLIAGMAGTGLGGVVGILLGRGSNKLTSLMFNLASGVMLGVVFFELIPEAISLASLYVVAIGIAIGIIFVFFVGSEVDKKLKVGNVASDAKRGSANAMVKVGIIIFFSITIHNLPEGLVIGSSTLISHGLVTTILIGLHNVPEGMAMALPLVDGGYGRVKTVLLCLLSGSPTVIGALIGYAVGSVSPILISLSVSIAAGAMMCIVFSEMIPKAHEISGENFKMGTSFLIAGAILALFMGEFLS